MNNLILDILKVPVQRLALPFIMGNLFAFVKWNRKLLHNTSWVRVIVRDHF